MSERKLTAAQKAAIARNAATKAAKEKVETPLSDAVINDIGDIGDIDGLDNVFDKNKTYLKIRSNNGVTLIQDGCNFDCNGKPLSLLED